eukprot:13151146-Alexandrium_andersonii.AAC.1
MPPGLPVGGAPDAAASWRRPTPWARRRHARRRGAPRPGNRPGSRQPKAAGSPTAPCGTEE